MSEPWNMAIRLVSELAERYRISSIDPLLASCRTVAAQDHLSIAILGRFKAGKSSFLNHFLGFDLLPVGVIPVTTVITEIGYGPRERALVHFMNGQSEEVAVMRIAEFIAETENPGNAKQVAVVSVELPGLARFRDLRFVDMPGLESVLAHNTEASLEWLPNVGLALVAVSVDPPLTQQDLALLKSLYQYTPKVSILLTKIDLLNEHERNEVLSFVRDQLKRAFGSAPPIFPYSVRSGHEEFQAQVEQNLIEKTLDEFHEHRNAILERKLETLVRECGDYLRLALKSTEMIESEREALKRQVLGEKESLDEEKSELRLVVQHAAGGTRPLVSKRLESYQTELERCLVSGLTREFPNWTRSLNHALQSFEEWLRRLLVEELSEIAEANRANFVAPLSKLEKQVFRSLQNFRDRLSDRTERAFGVPLRTTEAEIEVEEPHRPDIRIGRVFDRNWELLSPVAPMSLVQVAVRRHFESKVPDIVEENISRLTTQWTDSINAAMAQVGKEAERRLDELIETLEHLIASGLEEVPKIRADLERLNSAGDEIRQRATSTVAR